MSQILGWLIIGLSVTLGEQFWFDLFQTAGAAPHGRRHRRHGGQGR
jgi:hypothetical protein